MYNCCLFVLNTFKTKEAPKTAFGVKLYSASKLVYFYSTAIQAKNIVEELLRMNKNWK